MIPSSLHPSSTSWEEIWGSFILLEGVGTFSIVCEIVEPQMCFSLKVEQRFAFYSLTNHLLFLIQSEIEKLKAENDRLKSENQGSCSRAQSQVSISSSPRQSMGLSQHSLNLTESASLGEYVQILFCSHK